MIKIRIRAPEPFWLEPREGIRMLMAPIDPVGRAVAQAGGRARLLDGGVHAIAAGGVAYTVSLVQWGIRGWEGDFVDEDGASLFPTPEAIEALLLDPAHRDIYDFLDREYVIPSLMLDAEKNVSSPSPDGGTERAGTATAQPAPASAKSARKSSTPRKPPKALEPGASSRPARTRSGPASKGPTG